MEPATHAPTRPRPAGLLALLRQRRRFRHLYLADSLSMLGDWLTYVAVGLLALRSPQGIYGVALVQLAHSLPQAFTAPLAGWLTDRVDRRALLVGGSVGRGAVTAGMAFAALQGEIVWVEVLLFVRMAGAAFIAAPSRAALPRLVRRSELEPANRLLGSTWAVLFTLGVALGGVVAGAFGPTVALVVDAGTFFVAASLFAYVGRLPPAPRTRPDADPGGTPGPASVHAPSLLIDGRRSPDRLRAALAKVPVLFTSGAAFVVLHGVVGSGAGAAFGLGGLHAARGVGSGIGPWLFRRAGGRRAVLGGTVIAAVGALLLAVGSPVAWLVGCLLWGVGVGAAWVGSSVWLQTVTPDGVLGRYAALDLGASSVASACGGLLAAGLCVATSPTVAALAVAGLAALMLRPLRPFAAVAFVLVVTAPTAAQPASARPTSARPASSEPPPNAIEVTSDRLEARAVTESSFVRSELFTWTTSAQAEVLRRDRILLTSTADDGRRSPYQRALDEVRAEGGVEAQLATHLTEHPQLARRRYAWSTPYGTVVPRGSRPYGTVLVRIELSPGSWTVRFAPEERPRFRVVDADGAEVELGRAVRDPTRIAAVYHVRADPRLGAYREYIVHRGVARWSIGTPAIEARLDEDLRVVHRLRRVIRRDLRPRAMRRHWQRLGPTLVERYAATMPFDTHRHRPAPETFAALEAALRRRRRALGPALVVSEEPSP